MSCEDCEKRQELNRNGEELVYLRVGNANVLIGACDKHFLMIRNSIYHKEPVEVDVLPYWHKIKRDTVLKETNKTI